MADNKKQFKAMTGKTPRRKFKFTNNRELLPPSAAKKNSYYFQLRMQHCPCREEIFQSHFYLQLKDIFIIDIHNRLKSRSPASKYNFVINTKYGQKESTISTRMHEEYKPECDPLIQQACVLQQLLDHDRNH